MRWPYWKTENLYNYLFVCYSSEIKQFFPHSYKFNNMNSKFLVSGIRINGNLDVIITRAVNEAVKAWNNNEELRNLYNPLGASGDNLSGNGNVGILLQTIHNKRQIIYFVPPNPTDRMLSHAVTTANDFYNTPTRKFAARETILVSNPFFADNIADIVSFENATSKEVHSVTRDQMRAIILLHEARHLYTLTGHGVDPASYDPTWNDYILWTGFLGQKVARTVG